MKDVKLADVSGTKKWYPKAKIDDLEIKSKNKYIRMLYSGINDFKMGYQSRTNIVKGKKGDLVTDCHSIVLGGGTISRSHWMYIGLMMPSRHKYSRSTSAWAQCL
jgi:hypothetical protein